VAATDFWVGSIRHSGHRIGPGQSLLNTISAQGDPGIKSGDAVDGMLGFKEV
jgi:hypothetical protein